MGTMGRTARHHWCAIFISAALVAAGLAGLGTSTPAGADGSDAPGNPAVAASITAGLSHTCAILTDHTVKCWGRNQFGQLGLGDKVNRGDDPGEMGAALPAVALGTGRTATAITAGQNHTCALLDDSTVKCWGYAGYGALGSGNQLNRGDETGEMGDNMPVVDLGTGRTATAISATADFTCALLDNATIKCWGNNVFGVLGLGAAGHRGDGAGEMGDNLPAVDLGPGRTALAVVTGGLQACAILDDHTVKCWGNNEFGQLGLGDTVIRGDNAGEMGANLPIVALGAGRTALSIASGEGSTCALLDDHSVKCWGVDDHAQLGDGGGGNRGDAAGEMGDALPAVDLGRGRTATAMTSGGAHVCVLLDDHTTKCWGDNAYGQLGDPTSTGRVGDALPPVPLGTGRTAVAITNGAAHSCALLDDGHLKCWGDNGNGKLGQGDVARRGDGAGELGDALPFIDLGEASAPTIPAGFGVVSGTVTERVSNSPVPNALVTALTQDFAFVALAQADAQGHYSFEVPVGDHYLYLLDAGFAHTAGFHGSPAPTTVTVRDQAETDVDPVMVSTTGSITGSITETGTGRPIPGAVAIVLAGATTTPGPSGTASDTGAFSIVGVPTGDRPLLIADLTGRHRPEFYDTRTNPEPGLGIPTIGVTDATATTGVDVDLDPQDPPTGGAHLVGTVRDDSTGEPIEGIAAVAVHAATYQFAAGDVTDADGHYDIDVDPGEYKLEFGDTLGRYRMEWHDDLPFSGIESASTVTAPATTDAALTPNVGGVAGVVTEAGTRQPLAGVFVIAIGVDGTDSATTTAADGTYTLPSVPIGPHHLRFVDVTGRHVSEYLDDSIEIPTDRPLSIVGGRRIRGVDAQLAQVAVVAS
jgi:alpha-tubulin suppressor-like RCC1 family protein